METYYSDFSYQWPCKSACLSDSLLGISSWYGTPGRRVPDLTGAGGYVPRVCFLPGGFFVFVKVRLRETLW